MKKWAFCFCIFLLNAWANNLSLALENKSPIDIKQFKNPFYDDVKTDSHLKIQAILDEKVKINGKWYRKNEIIDDIYLLEIHKDFILIQKGGEFFRLKAQRLDHKIRIH